MNEWKELKIDNLPPDILTGDYEFESWENFMWISKQLLRINILKHLTEGGRYRYRKPEPKQPTHEEIMSKWWNVYDNVWSKVITYDGAYWMHDKEDGGFAVLSRETFSGRESRDIPPETE